MLYHLLVTEAQEPSISLLMDYHDGSSRLFSPRSTQPPSSGGSSMMMARVSQKNWLLIKLLNTTTTTDNDRQRSDDVKWSPFGAASVAPPVPPEVLLGPAGDGCNNSRNPAAAGPWLGSGV